MNSKDTKFLDGLRIILALWVGIGHLYQHVGGEKLFKMPFWAILKYPGPAVDGFMVITGFLMMFHYSSRQHIDSPEKTSTKIRFYLKRFFRLYPVYFFVIIAGYFTFPFINSLAVQMNDYFEGTKLVSFTYGLDKTLDWRDLLTHLTFIHGLLPNYNSTIIGPSWSLSTEVQFYLIFPFLFLALRKYKDLVSFLLIAAVAYWFSNRLLGVWEAPGTFTTFGAPSLIIQKMIYFSLGMFLAQYKLAKCRINMVLFNLAVIAFLSVTPVSTVICTIITVLLLSKELTPYLAKPLVTLIDATKRFLSGKASGFGADISYSFYLTHIVLIPVAFKLALMSGFDTKKSVALASVGIFLVLSVSLSYVLFLFVEKPFISIGKKVTATKTKTVSHSKEPQFVKEVTVSQVLQ